MRPCRGHGIQLLGYTTHPHIHSSPSQLLTCTRSSGEIGRLRLVRRCRVQAAQPPGATLASFCTCLPHFCSASCRQKASSCGHNGGGGGGGAEGGAVGGGARVCAIAPASTSGDHQSHTHCTVRLYPCSSTSVPSRRAQRHGPERAAGSRCPAEPATCFCSSVQTRRFKIGPVACAAILMAIRTPAQRAQLGLISRARVQGQLAPRYSCQISHDARAADFFAAAATEPPQPQNAARHRCMPASVVDQARP